MAFKSLIWLENDLPRGYIPQDSSIKVGLLPEQPIDNEQMKYKSSL